MFIFTKIGWEPELWKTEPLTRNIVLEEATTRRADSRSNGQPNLHLPLLLPFNLLPIFRWSHPTRTQRAWSPPLPPCSMYHKLTAVLLIEMENCIRKELEFESHGNNKFTTEFVSLRCLQTTWLWISRKLLEIGAWCSEGQNPPEDNVIISSK